MTVSQDQMAGVGVAIILGAAIVTIVWFRIRISQFKREAQEHAVAVYLAGLKEAEEVGRKRLEGKSLEDQVAEINRMLSASK